MNFIVAGPGKMGLAAREVAEQRGHRFVGNWDSLRRCAVEGADVAFEFSNSSVAETNVTDLLDAGISVVCGTTGWAAESLTDRKKPDRCGWIVEPNFSIGMHLFAGMARYAAATIGRTGLYQPWLLERHHRAKRDNPSGTARKLAEILREGGSGIRNVVENSGGQSLDPEDLHVVGVRTGHEPGLHTIGFDGLHDEITLTHRARSRHGFAFGAVLAAEWLQGRTGGHTFDEVVEALWDSPNRHDRDGQES